MALDPQEAKSVLQTGVQSTASLINAASNVATPIVDKIFEALLRKRQEEGDELTEEEIAALKEEAKEYYQYVEIPNDKRVEFEVALASEGIEYVPSPVKSALGHAGYDLKEKDMDRVDEIASEIRKRGGYSYVLINDAQESAILKGCPVKEISGLDYAVANRLQTALNEKGIYSRSEYDDITRTYSIKVKSSDFNQTVEELKRSELYFHTNAGSLEKLRLLNLQKTQNLIKDLPNREEKMVIYDAENPEHRVIANKDGCIEMLGDKEIGFKAYNEKNKDIYELFIDNAVSIMGTPTVCTKDIYDTTDPEKLRVPGDLTRTTIQSEVVLSREGDDLFKEFKIELTNEGMVVSQIGGFSAGEDFDHSKTDAAVKQEIPESLQVKEEIITIETVKVRDTFAKDDLEYELDKDHDHVRDDIEAERENRKEQDAYNRLNDRNGNGIRDEFEDRDNNGIPDYLQTKEPEQSDDELDLPFGEDNN